MSVGDTFDGQIGNTGDIDWIKVDLVAGESCVFTMWGTDYLFGITDTLLTLYNPSGSQVAFNDEISPFSSFSRFSYTAASTGTHYVEADGYFTDTGSYRIQVADAVFTPEQVAVYLTEVDWGVPVPIRLDAQVGGTLTYNTTFLTDAGKQLAEWALETWSIATGITFKPGGFSTSDILFDDKEPGAFAGPLTVNNFTGVIDQSSVNVGTVYAATSWLDFFGTTIDSYSFVTYLHEIGHALGLGHAGPYDGLAIYGSDNLYANDSTQMSIMSYFDSSSNPTVSGDDVLFITPMPADLIAIQTLYRTAQVYQGNTVWGANSNVGGWLGQFFGAVFDGDSVSTDFYWGEKTGFTIHDTGGTDMLDVSGGTMNQRIDLREGQFSDVNGAQRNVTIAQGTVIENAIGGAGNYSIIGGAGDDALFDGAGTNVIEGSTGNDNIGAGFGDDTLDGETGNDNMGGGEGDDTLVGGDGNDFWPVAGAMTGSTAATGVTASTAVWVMTG